MVVDEFETLKEANALDYRGAYPLIREFLPEWTEQHPYQIKKIAVKDCITAHMNGFKKGQKFEIKFRSRKDPVQSCFIPHQALRSGGIYVEKSGVVHFTESLPENPKDSRLILDHGRWFLHVPYSTTHSDTKNEGGVVALDPGIRTFITGYSENNAFKIGEHASDRIFKLSLRMDKLVSKISKAARTKKRSYKRALDRLKWKVWDLVSELHNKTAAYLCKNFSTILLPTFDTSEMVIKNRRKIRSKTVRSMLSFAFYKFSQRLIARAERSDVQVVRVNEAYTSKTASWSGEIVQIGGSKTITSNGITLDRDLNGARGIFLRAMREMARSISTSNQSTL
jgi:putative transposase